MSDQNKGHRERLRKRFISGEVKADDEVTLLELLLMYAVPLVDVRPHAQTMLTRFGSLEEVLRANYADLCQIPGIKEYAATLIKLVNTYANQPDAISTISDTQMSIFDPPRYTEAEEKTIIRQKESSHTAKPRRGTGMFAKSLLSEAIAVLPNLPETDSFDSMRTFIQNQLRFSAVQTRERYTRYIMRHLFPTGILDMPLRQFAKRFAGKSALAEVCFYRFCIAEPLMYDVIKDVISPAIGAGEFPKSSIRDYLLFRFGQTPMVKDCAAAIIEALIDGGIVRANQHMVTIAYREIVLPVFAFILHSEFPDPGMYDIGLLAENCAITALLWNSDRILPALYELRNRSLISKVSEIDSVRQFSTKYTLEELVAQLRTEGASS